MCLAASRSCGCQRAGCYAAADRAGDVWEEPGSAAAASHTSAVQLQHLEQRRLPAAHRLDLCWCVCARVWKHRRKEITVLSKDLAPYCLMKDSVSDAVFQFLDYYFIFSITSSMYLSHNLYIFVAVGCDAAAFCVWNKERVFASVTNSILCLFVFLWWRSYPVHVHRHQR